MDQSVKITSFEAENIKRVKAVELKPSESGLTVIGGRNGQGKTSVLDAIAWALGGNRFKPSNAKREGSTTDPRLRVELSNGIVVERKGINSSLKVTDPSGNKSGQNLLDSFLEQLALDLPKFMNASDKEKLKRFCRSSVSEMNLTDLMPRKNSFTTSAQHLVSSPVRSAALQKI